MVRIRKRRTLQSKRRVLRKRPVRKAMQTKRARNKGVKRVGNRAIKKRVRGYVRKRRRPNRGNRLKRAFNHQAYNAGYNAGYEKGLEDGSQIDYTASA